MTKRSVSCALIPAAGLGTRFLPVTKVVPKELLPLGVVPVIHLLVEEAVAGGASEIVIVIRREKEAIREYFTITPGFQELLAGIGKLPCMEPLTRLLKQVDIRFVYQDEPLGLGDAVLRGAELIGNRPFLVLLGDAPIAAATPVCCQLVECYEKYQASILGLQEVPADRTSSYGIVAGQPVAEAVLKLHSLIEKPPKGTAPSRLAISGRYLLSPAIFAQLRKQTPGVGGEIQLTDAIAALLQSEPVFGRIYEGRRYDIGNPDGYLQAQLAWK